MPKRSTKTDSKASKQLRKKPRKKKLLNHAQAKKKVDEWFSKYVRWREADQDGNCKCITCGRTHHASKINAGHFVSRRYPIYRWELDNVRPQCVACNIYAQGEQYLFAQAIEREKRGRAEELMRTKDTPRKYTVGELRNMFEHYRTLALRIAQEKDVMPKR